MLELWEVSELVKLLTEALIFVICDRSQVSQAFIKTASRDDPRFWNWQFFEVQCLTSLRSVWLHIHSLSRANQIGPLLGFLLACIGLSEIWQVLVKRELHLL